MAPQNFTNRAPQRSKNRRSRQKSNYTFYMILIGTILVLVMSLSLGISVLSSHQSDVNALDFNSGRGDGGSKGGGTFDLFVGNDGIISSDSTHHQTGTDDWELSELGGEYGKIRAKALEDAKAQTLRRKKMRTYEFMLRDSRKQIYIKVL